MSTHGCKFPDNVDELRSSEADRRAFSSLDSQYCARGRLTDQVVDSRFQQPFQFRVTLLSDPSQPILFVGAVLYESNRYKTRGKVRSQYDDPREMLERGHAHR